MLTSKRKVLVEVQMMTHEQLRAHFARNFANNDPFSYVAAQRLVMPQEPPINDTLDRNHLLKWSMYSIMLFLQHGLRLKNIEVMQLLHSRLCHGGELVGDEQILIETFVDRVPGIEWDDRKTHTAWTRCDLVHAHMDWAMERRNACYAAISCMRACLGKDLVQVIGAYLWRNRYG